MCHYSCVITHVDAADTTHYLETECMREAMEEMLYTNGVDIVLNGHLHEYERTNPVFVSLLLASACGCASACHGDTAVLHGTTHYLLLMCFALLRIAASQSTDR